MKDLLSLIHRIDRAVKEDHHLQAVKQDGPKVRIRKKAKAPCSRCGCMYVTPDTGTCCTCTDIATGKVDAYEGKPCHCGCTLKYRRSYACIRCNRKRRGAQRKDEYKKPERTANR